MSEASDGFERGEEYWHDRDVAQVLSTLSVTDYDITESQNDALGLTLTLTADPIFVQSLFGDRRAYLEAHDEAEPSVEDVVEYIVADLSRALDATFNTVSHDRLPDGLYRRINDSQWEAVEDNAVYDDYSELLWEVTDGLDVEPEALSVPTLKEPFLEACAESDAHELPHPGAVTEILLEHIRLVKSEEQSRAAESVLKQELEANGVDPRTAASVANNIDDRVLVSDAELEE